MLSNPFAVRTPTKGIAQWFIKHVAGLSHRKASAQRVRA